MGSPDRVFSPAFFAMCGFTLTVFLSLFLVLPTMPYRILALGGTRAEAGLFLGMLTFASAASAPFTGALADRLGRTRILVTSSLVIAGFTAAYAVAPDPRLPLALALVHGGFWSALLGASAAQVADILPAHRRAEGIGYWGLATMLAIACAPAIGFHLLQSGWIVVCAVSGGLNLTMAAIAGTLVRPVAASVPAPPRAPSPWVEWRVLLLSLTLLLYSFGYGGITSFVALYADFLGAAPRSLFFSVFALTVVATRPFSGPLADRVGHRVVLLPCLAGVALGLGILSVAQGRLGLTAAALVFGAGFGSAYPVYAAHVMRHVTADRRGAAFGAILAAFDLGIGGGSVVTGALVERFGFRVAYGVAAALATLSVPCFLLLDRPLLGPPRE